ncbi:MAG: LPS export ABC transporter ATP-binding protein [Betaproteobacteria bacterium]
MVDTELLVAKQLCKKYGPRTVVKDISFTVKEGEVVGLLGPNGAGKTTTFYIVVGIIKSDGGSLLLRGKDITHLPIHKRAKLGMSYLPQEASIFRKLNVEQNVAAILELSGSRNINEDTRSLLSELGVEHLRKSTATSLSGGERRRVEIARALATRPSVILLDEPFAGVDPIAVLEIKNIIRFLTKRGLGVIITDHNVRETLDICDRAYIINEGGVLASGNSAEIIHNEHVRRVYLGADFRL